ncbi:glycogen-binding subunit 76A isoform X2 [Maniola jurtina]|uniref:glycogen-binding subunit 76A isoform X2 n=1 Tax=Maniola jurtina TaxID=191418 RepID=UPI001E68A6B1|nr:glycogen-binding subunit 76A isoform X2 [Maniola jurtina]
MWCGFTSAPKYKTQMSGDRTGPQCGLTSLLPMSCRGRAAAFARDLHSRLRNLGATQEGECENSWLTRENPTHRPTSSTQRELDTFFDFELECGSPSSPVDEYDAPFPEKPTEDSDPPFYDVDSDVEHKEQSKLMLKQPDKGKNGFKFSTAFYTESPVKLQPTARENGHVDKPLYSPITFEGCARHNSYDEIDCLVQPVAATDRLSLLPQLSSTLDSDSEFESAKSDPSDCFDDLPQNDNILENDLTDVVEILSITDSETLNEEEISLNSEEKEDFESSEKIVVSNGDSNELKDIGTSVVSNDDKEIVASAVSNGDSNELTEIDINEVPIEKEPSPAPDIDPQLLSIETKTEDEGEDDRPQRVRRCSSLKTGKTPPGTPGRKKIVRFADVLGLDLADVKTFMDEIPVIPKSAYDDLTGCDVQSSPPARPSPRLGALTLVPLFQLPRDVTEKLEKQNVCLESSRVCDGVHVTICGSVRVRNLDFHKTVHIRYTMNRWKTYTDLQATYVQGSCDGYSDRFQFVLYAPCISSGQRMEIAVRFQCKGQQFWDNNSGANYCFDCLALGAATSASPASLHPTVDWHPSFY